MKKYVIFMVLTLGLATNSLASCEKWKSEIASTVFELGSYISAYNNYKSQKIKEGAFIDKANDIVEKLQKIKNRVLAVESCMDQSKFENRRSALLSVLNYSIPIIKYGKYLMPEKREELKKHED
jgi:hypothetical protein